MQLPRYLHDIVGIVHCDVKPDNLLLRHSKSILERNIKEQLVFAWTFADFGFFSKIADFGRCVSKFGWPCRVFRFEGICPRLGWPGSEALRLWHG